jgi:ribulose-5-phosphate 4-epimerase/fuculose-1-phosphate aldolase
MVPSRIPSSVYGHVSVRDPDGRGAWMKASTYGFEKVGVEQVILVDRAGQVVEGDGRRHAEYPLHTEVMAARPDVNSVVHTHAPDAVALGATGHPLRPISHEATLFVPPPIARFTKTGDLILPPTSAVTSRRRSASATRCCSSTTAS